MEWKGKNNSRAFKIIRGFLKGELLFFAHVLLSLQLSRRYSPDSPLHECLSGLTIWIVVGWL